jgi:hypothetical protein
MKDALRMLMNAARLFAGPQVEDGVDSYMLSSAALRVP